MLSWHEAKVGLSGHAGAAVLGDTTHTHFDRFARRLLRSRSTGSKGRKVPTCDARIKEIIRGKEIDKANRKDRKRKHAKDGSEKEEAPSEMSGPVVLLSCKRSGLRRWGEQSKGANSKPWNSAGYLWLTIKFAVPDRYPEPRSYRRSPLR